MEPFCRYYGAEMTARRVKQWLQTVGTQPLFIEPGSPWENAYCESFNGKLRNECLKGGDLLLAERSLGGYRNVAQAPQHYPPTQRPRLSSPGTAQLDHRCLDQRLPSPARSSLRPDCARRPGSDDELAPLGLDSVLAGLLNLISRRRNTLKGWTNHQACREAILSLSDWHKTSGRAMRCRVPYPISTQS
jgi:transposase InsO family protein